MNMHNYKTMRQFLWLSDCLGRENMGKRCWEAGRVFGTINLSGSIFTIYKLGFQVSK